MKQYTKQENSWMLYDWANSAFAIIIMTAVFPLFYKAAATNAGISGADSTAYLGYTIAIATFILAMLGPDLRNHCRLSGIQEKVFPLLFCAGYFIYCPTRIYTG